MIKRVITAVVGIPLMVVLIFLGGNYFLGAVMLLSLLASVELGRILRRLGVDVMLSLLYTGAILFPLLLSFEPSWLPSFFAFFLFSGAMIMVSRYPQSDFSSISMHLFGLLYVPIGFAHFLLLRGMQQGMLLVGYAFSIVWLTDIGAYFIGTYLGKHPLYASISPNKTVEGSVGGLLSGMIGGILYAIVLNRYMPLDNMGFLIFLTPVLSIIGQFGDLFESAIKRQARVKDSSQILPGHGGVLDRFDSALWVIPLLYHILRIRTQIFL